MCRCISRCSVSEVLTYSGSWQREVRYLFVNGRRVQMQSSASPVRTCVRHRPLHHVPSRRRGPRGVAPAVRASPCLRMVALFIGQAAPNRTKPSQSSIGVVFPRFYHRPLHFELSPKSTASWAGLLAVPMLLIVAASEHGRRLNPAIFNPREVGVTSPHF